MSKFPHALEFILRDAIEGGFSDHPKDPGGPTNRGISLRAVRQLDGDRRLGTYLRDALDVDDDGDLDVDDVKGWTREVAIEFYRRFYWSAVRADDLPWPLALVVFDAAVNQGVGSAVEQLQELCRVPVDGVIGPKTLAAAAQLVIGRREAMALAAKRLIVARLERYRTLKNAPSFFRGWAARMLDLHVEVLQEVG